ncbi:GNAT family N-acetyltransferase [Sorangium sp. So ce388]|uniref:GNAT family N-acetyltransferase n=1 Tax=Sorangium sp. So ce388 TaxID=3133309 RepID=UPI003F5CB36E
MPPRALAPSCRRTGPRGHDAPGGARGAAGGASPGGTRQRRTLPVRLTAWLGTGAILLEAVIARLRALGAPRVVLHTATQNAAAQRLFERFGFRRTMIEMTLEL